LGDVLFEKLEGRRKSGRIAAIENLAGGNWTREKGGFCKT